MINLFKRNNAREEEEKKKKEEADRVALENGEAVGPSTTGRVKKSPGELRLKKEIAELDLPSHAEIHFPDGNDIMKFELYVDLTKEECLWKGAKYKFTV
jgi:hypothetical protein